MNGRILPVRLLAWAGIGLVPARRPRAHRAGARSRPPPLPPPVNQSRRSDPARSFVWRSIGPANMGGRIDDIAVDREQSLDVSTSASRPAASGRPPTTARPGRRSSTSYPVSSIGDIALAPVESRTSSTSAPASRTTARAPRSAPASTSPPTRGKDFDVHRASRRRRPSPASSSHPKDPNIVYVAAVGHLFGPNPERGLYKTTDGGKTWTNTKFIDNDTGFTDVVMRSRRTRTSSSPRRTSGGGSRGASTAAAPAAASGRRPTARRPGRG